LVLREPSCQPLCGMSMINIVVDYRSLRAGSTLACQIIN
jgi:hypothetical protein